ncbi:hypothetical protein ACFWUW_33265 [Streptomyces sp. NPDC058655]|uniref:hypothetical protein n=1 Tax=Streptomyces sp. NPDC058655 TaxID=3346577 RepID=UPI00366A1951
MTLLSDQAEDIRALVEAADPDAVWAVGGPEGVHAASAAREAANPGAAAQAEEPGRKDADSGRGGFESGGGARGAARAAGAVGQAGRGGDALLDVGGLIAVLALWPAIGSLVDEGALHLHTPLTAYGDPDAAPGITAHHLLTHPEGSAALTRLAERLSGTSLAELAAARVWHPLGMTRTHFADGTLRAPLADLVRFPRHLLAADGPGVAPGWTAESLRIRTGELTPARGLLWHPAPHGVWAHHAPEPAAPALWVAPRRHRWALLLPTAGHGAFRTAFREAVFASPSAG